MIQLLVRYNPEPDPGDCALCGLQRPAPAGVQLVTAESRQPVCQACGRRHNPSLAALVHLADEAERVGRIGRHTVVPPYTALLGLAQAADNFVATTPAARAAG